MSSVFITQIHANAISKKIVILQIFLKEGCTPEPGLHEQCIRPCKGNVSGKPTLNVICE